MPYSSLVFKIDNAAVPDDQIHGAITITRRESEAAIMSVTLLPPVGIQDIDAWAGKAVTLDVDGTRAYTGIIDTPVISLISKKITLECTDRRREIINAQDVSGVGYHSLSIFEEPDSVFEELEQRLQTTAKAVDIKSDGSYALTDINPKATADIVLNDSDVRRRTPSVSPISRGRLVNKITLTFDYRYIRLRHRERNFRIENYDVCDALLHPAVGATKETEFLNYAASMGWLLNDTTVVFEDFPPSQWYNCNGTEFGWVSPPGYAIAIEYTAAKRFSQTLTEKTSITVQAPQSISQYGAIEQQLSNSHNVDYDQAGWEAFGEFAAPSGGTDDPNDYYIDQTGLIADYENAILTAINIASTKIIQSHRDTSIDFTTDLRLDFDLTKTIQLSISVVAAIGKIVDIVHSIDIANRFTSTDTIIKLSTAQGAQTTDPIVVPARPAAPVITEPYDNPYLMHIADNQLITPDIDDLSRQEQIIESANTYNIEIQNDPFQVIF